MHNENEILLGTTKESFKTVDSYPGSIGAGFVCNLDSAGALAAGIANGVLGVSLGDYVQTSGHTSVCRQGLGVPVRLKGSFDPSIGDQVNIEDATGLAQAAGAGATGVDAIYKSGAIDGVLPDGSKVKVALIDFQGGL